MLKNIYIRLKKTGKISFSLIDVMLYFSEINIKIHQGKWTEEIVKKVILMKLWQHTFLKVQYSGI